MLILYDYNTEQLKDIIEAVAHEDAERCGHDARTLRDCLGSSSATDWEIEDYIYEQCFSSYLTLFDDLSVLGDGIAYVKALEVLAWSQGYNLLDSVDNEERIAYYSDIIDTAVTYEEYIELAKTYHDYMATSNVSSFYDEDALNLMAKVEYMAFREHTEKEN